MSFLIFAARVLFSSIFISSGLNHLRNTDQMSQYAASKNVPVPKVAVFISGVMLVVGGLSILLGLWVDVGALLLVAFLIPAAFMMHDFWRMNDPESRQNEQIHFFKDLALAGGAFLIWYLYETLVNVPWSLHSVFY